MLPSQRTLLTSLITTLSHPQTSNSLNRRKLLLTLHVIFPRILLPALDLLDRNLITEYTTKSQNVQNTTTTTPQSASHPNTSPHHNMSRNPRLHLVRSLASTLNRKDAKTYLIHLDAWSCSCPSFILEAFSGAGDGDTALVEEGWSFGGLSGENIGAAGERLPCCKHLLACLLADRWEAFGEYVTKKECTINEMAGLVAGI